jgi:branched-subunit amino acid aminotransferase/4-amino-4-deoxychorismate lyase
MRDSIIETCKEMKIEIKYEIPNIKDFENWNEVFISSTSRILLPIDTGIFF